MEVTFLLSFDPSCASLPQYFDVNNDISLISPTKHLPSQCTHGGQGH